MAYYMEHRETAKRRTGDAVRPRTNVSEDLMARFEDMSGYSFDDVRIHYNSGRPARMGAAAYTTGVDVYLGAGQEKYLGHELGHVLQQKRKSVRPELVYRGMAVNADPALEREADLLAARAIGNKARHRETEHSVSGGVKRNDAAVSAGGAEMAQMARWQWSAALQTWKRLDGTPVSGRPQHLGTRDGEIYDDEEALRSLTVVGKKITPPETPEPFRYDSTYMGDDEQYRESMEVLQDIVLNGGELNERQQQQMNTYFSNAGFFLRVLQEMRRRPIGSIRRGREWNDALTDFLANAGISVFTRDIDSGELENQPASGGTMSVVERMKRGFGRIRNYKDLNRGGGGGSYVRFVAERKRRVAGEGKSNTLNVGSLASAGVTVLYDAASVVRDNSAPAHMAFNKQDSAGRIFGTSGDTPEELRRNSRLSAEILSEANPDNQHPILRPGGAPALDEDYIMGNAIEGLREMTRQASLGQSVKEEYNETILFSGAKISSIKAVLIHMPMAPKGGPPARVNFTEQQIRRQRGRHDRAQQVKDDSLMANKLQIGEIDREVRRLKEESLVLSRGSNAYNDRLRRMIELEKEKTRLIEGERDLRMKKVPEVKSFRFVSPKQVSTDVTLRSPYLYEKGQLPEKLQKWYDETGYGGVPMRYLFFHVNPNAVRREALPGLADRIWNTGYAKWQADIRKEAQLRSMQEQGEEDVRNLRLTGRRLQ